MHQGHSTKDYCSSIFQSRALGCLSRHRLMHTTKLHCDFSKLECVSLSKAAICCTPLQQEVLQNCLALLKLAMRSCLSTAVLWRASCTMMPGTSSNPPTKAPSASSSASPVPYCNEQFNRNFLIRASVKQPSKTGYGEAAEMKTSIFLHFFS